MNKAMNITEYVPAEDRDITFATIDVAIEIDKTCERLNVVQIKHGNAIVYGNGKTNEDFAAWLDKITLGAATCPLGFIDHIERVGA